MYCIIPRSPKSYNNYKTSEKFSPYKLTLMTVYFAFGIRSFAISYLRCKKTP